MILFLKKEGLLFGKIRLHGEKSKLNIKKHGVSSEEAISIFEDPSLKLAYDRHVKGEDRYISADN